MPQPKLGGLSEQPVGPRLTSSLPELVQGLCAEAQVQARNREARAALLG
jgi:uncharacterized protein YidB (DUF937 family)